VKAGDSLPALCYQIYGDPGYYLEVARFNRLDDFRRLQPGTRVVFPPVRK
jgi:nucleoid-associated protein YgaU